jgi:hypothetical protein
MSQPSLTCSGSPTLSVWTYTADEPRDATCNQHAFRTVLQFHWVRGTTLMGEIQYKTKYQYHRTLLFSKTEKAEHGCVLERATVRSSSFLEGLDAALLTTVQCWFSAIKQWFSEKLLRKEGCCICMVVLESSSLFIQNCLH